MSEVARMVKDLVYDIVGGSGKRVQVEAWQAVANAARVELDKLSSAETSEALFREYDAKVLQLRRELRERLTEMLGENFDGCDPVEDLDADDRRSDRDQR